MMGPPKSAPGKKAVKSPEGEEKTRRTERIPVVEIDRRVEKIPEARKPQKPKTVEESEEESDEEEAEPKPKKVEKIPENPYAHILPPRVELPSVQTPDRGIERQRRLQPELPKEILSGKEAEDAVAEEFVKKLFEVPIEVVTRDLIHLSKSVRAKIGKRLRMGKYGSRLIPVDKSRLVAQLMKETEETPAEGQERQRLDLWNVYNTNSITEIPTRTVALYQPASAPLKEPQVKKVMARAENGILETICYVTDPYEDYVRSIGDDNARPARFKVAPESRQLRVVEPLINGKVKVECILDGGSMIVTMSEVVARRADLNWNPDIVIQVESANQSIDTSLGLAENVPFRIGGIIVYLQVHIIRNAAYDVLLGRPFDCITQLVVQNSRDGQQLITLTDPNDEARRLTVPTQERRGRLLPRDEPAQGFLLASKT